MKFTHLLLGVLISFSLHAQDEDYNKKIEKQKNKFAAENWEYDSGNEDGVYRAQSKKTHKWGMFQLTDDMAEMLVPMNYDTLKFFGYNRPFTFVWNDGKLGVYFSPWLDKTKGQTVACIYDSGKIFHDSEDYYYFAAKKNGKWGWVDFYTGQDQSPFIVEAVSELRLNGNQVSTYYK